MELEKHIFLRFFAVQINSSKYIANIAKKK